SDRDAMVKSYGDFYFPLLRVGDEEARRYAGDGARFVNLPQPVRGRSAKGSGRQILDPFDSTVARTLYFYNRAAKSRVVNSLADMLDPARGGVEGMGGLLDRVDPKRKFHEGTVEEILGTLVKEGVVEADDARAMRLAQRIRDGEELPA